MFNPLPRAYLARMVRRWGAALCAGLVGVLATATAAPAFTSTWVRVGTGMQAGVSGVAPTSTGWMVVRDNKVAGQNRVALMTDAGAVTPLTWPGTQPEDLEALAAVPGRAGVHVALTSKGAGAVFTVSGTTLVISKRFQVPHGKGNIESFALTMAGTNLVAVWGTRGSPTSPATLWAAGFNPDTAAFGAVRSGKVTVPWPTTAVRHVSDLAVVGNRLIGSAASDPGTSGPFDSAVYDLGSVGWASGRATITIQTPSSLGTFPGHKIEGLTCSGTTGLLGSDDEKLGGWVRTFGFCG
jgi:hypothetical protein